MPYIKVNVDKINEYQLKAQEIYQQVYSISYKFSNINYALDYDVRSKNSIASRLNSIESNLSDNKNSLRRTSNFLGNTAITYTNAEKKLFVKNANTSFASSFEVEEPAIEETPQNTDEIIDDVSNQTGVSVEEIKHGLNEGWFTFNDVAGWISKGATGVNGFTKFLLNSVDYATDLNTGKLIVSGFSRDGLLNGVVKIFNKGKGIGTTYNRSTFSDTTLGKLNIFGDKLGKVVKGISTAADIIEAGVYAVDDVISATGKIKDIWADDTKSKNDKICETTAVGITSAVGLAYDVAAPFVGGVVAAAIPIPGVNIVAGALVSEAMHIMGDVVTSEAVVGAVTAGTKAISEAGKKVLESKNVGDAIVNTAALVGETAKAALVTTATVAVEAVKTTVNKVVDTGKKVVNWFKKW